MRRFVTLAVLLLFSIPFGVSIAGCSKGTTATFCNGSDSGLVVGQLTTLTLQPRLTGISLNEGQIGQAASPTGTDCKGSTVSGSTYTFGTTDMTLADINPANGALCGGSWNRNSGGGVVDFTTCTSTGRQGTAYITASAAGVSSNPIAVYVHPIVTSIVLGPASTNCVTDPATNCVLDATKSNGCSTAAVTAADPNTPVYTGGSCVSSGTTSQLAARVYKGTDTTVAANNISCLVGPLTYTPETATIVTVTQAGVATAAQPGTTILNANTSNSSSSAGLFSVCPPASIALTVGSSGATSASINQNTTQNLIATVVDTKGTPLTNLTLQYVSTSPITIPVSSSSVTPTFPGSAAVTAVCLPPSCNTAPFNQIGLFGSGLTVTSNPVQITSPGSNSTVLYAASTNSQYLIPIDFTTNTLGNPVRLPFAPNSMVLSQDLATIYMGTSTELMVVSATSTLLSKEDTSVAGSVLSVSPDSTTVVITDPNRKLIYLYSSAGSIVTEYGGVGTHAQWSPDSSRVYITTSTGQLLVYSTFTGWTSITPASTATDVAVTVPSQGAYFAGMPTTARTICPVSTVTGAAGSQIVTNQFYPQSDTAAVATDRVSATNDGKHILGAAASTNRLVDLTVTVPSAGLPSNSCPTNGGLQTFSNSPATSALGVTATSINGVLATSDSAFAFVTYSGTGSSVPQYAISTSTLKDLPLVTAAGSVAPIAPVSGVVSSDDQTVYVGTTGDNRIHLLTRGTAGFSDTSTIAPQLPVLSGTGSATPNLLVQRPRKGTS